MRKLNLVGKEFGRLTVIKEDENRGSSKDVRWICKCKCGKEKSIVGFSLNSGHTTSCGCYSREITKNVNTTHGKRNTPEYKNWAGMLYRCSTTRVNSEDYKNYVEKGVVVCERWKGENGFENFFLDLGPRPTPKHSVDRHPNKEGNYEPGNCRWATMKQQQGNRTNNRWIECDGESMILQDWARRLNVCHSFLQRHLKTKTMCQVIEYCNRRPK